jgi:hypothetical protein
MPSEEHIRRALEQLRKSGANREYFFSKVNSPEWLEPLTDAGLFRHPPQAIVAGDTISFPFWPESRYLARMAAVAPDLVFRIIESVPETNNVRIHENFVDAVI